MADPLSQVYTALWGLAEARCELTDLVRLGNRIRYDTTDRDPEKRNYVEADTPELSLLCSGFTGNMCNTSSTSMLTCRYTWVCVTGDLRLTHKMLPVEWALFLAMHGWREELGKLTWETKPYVKSANMLDVQEGILRPTEMQDGPRGWASLWGIQVTMYFDLADLQA